MEIEEGELFFFDSSFFFALFDHQRVKNILTVTNRLSGAFLKVNKYTRGAGSVQMISLSVDPALSPSSTPSLSSRIGISKSTLPALLVEAILGGRGVGRRFLESYSIIECYSKMSIALFILNIRSSRLLFFSGMLLNLMLQDVVVKVYMYQRCMR